MADVKPPYRRIVDDVRRRISSGELRPGDRVPSARQITRDRGVAIATATKALAALRQEGLTTVRPGVGTVVAGASRAPATRRGQGHETDLGRRRIVQTAIAIADAEGMAELSMRRIATELGVATMSLYRHVPGKDDLVLFMIDEVFGEEPPPATRPEGWRDRLELCARLQWRLFRRHRWLAPVMSLTRPQLAPNGLVHTEWTLSAFDGTDLGLGDRMYVHVALCGYVRGVATALEPETEAERDTGMTGDEWMETRRAELDALTASGSLPTLAALARRDDFDLDLDRLFAFGLALLLDGLEAFVAARATPA